MMRFFLLIFFIGGTSFKSPCAWGLGELFSGLSTNITQAGTFQDQAAGYASLGGISVRSSQRNIHPFAMTEPSLKMGNCGNIDMTFGSLSLVSGKELVDLMKRIGTQAKAYMMQLTLKTFAPQIENLLKDLRNLASQLNGVALNSCEMTQSLFASVLPKESAMRRHVCSDLARSDGGSDWFQARDMCRDDEEALKATNKVQQTHPNLLVGDYNLFIKAADKIGIPRSLSLPMMSMTGTIIVKEGQGIYLSSLIQDDKAWVTYLKGGEAGALYECGDKECLEVSLKKPLRISYDDSYQGKAGRVLHTIKGKMEENIAFSSEDIAFLSSVSEALPLYNYLTLEVVSGVHFLDKSSELVATYLLLQYISGIIQETKQALSVLKSKQINDEHIKSYLSSLDKLHTDLQRKNALWLSQAQELEKMALRHEAHALGKLRF